MAQHYSTQMQPSSKSPCSGRRRSDRCHQAILVAAAELLEEKGYTGVSIEAIAARAGVGKQTIYRWWSSKAALIMEAYAAQATHQVLVPDIGSAKEDLYQLLKQLFTELTTTAAGPAVAGLIAEAQNEPDVAEAFQKQFISGRRAAARTILERGILRGELRPNLNLELAIDAVYGPVWYRLLLKHAPLSDRFAEELVNQLMIGMQAFTINKKVESRKSKVEN